MLPTAPRDIYSASRPRGTVITTRNPSSGIDMGINVKGKGSIRTLIRLANTRAMDEEVNESTNLVNDQ